MQQLFLDNEKEVLKKIEANYEDALSEINSKIELLMARQDADMQHVIYQVEYQKALKDQVSAILEQLHNNEFETVSEYLAQSYEDGFIGTMYDLQGQGIPLIIPLDQEQVVAAIQHETKLSESLYMALGRDTKDLSKKIAGEISRGISNAAMYSEIARNIAAWGRIPKNNAMRIARTEAHRIQIQATADAQWKAKANGADVVKQWDASLDKKTRKSHRELDGQIRELDEPFEVNGHKAMQPGGFGRPEEDINCRCALLQRARWNLDSDYTKWSEDAPIEIADDGTSQLAYIPAKNYKDFKEQYNQASERVRDNVQKINENSVLNIQKPQRPKKQDFENEEDYLEARNKYREDREKYENRMAEIVKNESNKPRKYNTEESIRDWATKNNVRIEKSVFENVDLRIMDDVISVQEEMFSRFPMVKKAQDSLYPYGFSYNVGDNSDYIFEASTGLNFGRCWTDYENGLLSTLGEIAGGYFTKGDGTIKGVVRHEFGHNVDNYIRLDKYKTLDVSKEVAETNSKLKRKYEDELIEITKKHCKTEYAFTNTSEAFAEGFAEYTSNPNTEYGKAFGEFLKRWL